MVLLFASFGLPAYEGAARLGAIAAMLWGFAPAGLALTYLLQAAFEVRAGGDGVRGVVKHTEVRGNGTAN